MDFGTNVVPDIAEADYAVLAEQLGYTHYWVGDNPMMWSDPYATLALIAERTSTIRIGTGVAVAGTRPAAVTAAAAATLNRIAPGRVFCGVGAGNTAMRTLGQVPLRIKQFERYLRELRPLLSGEEVTIPHRDGPKVVRHFPSDPQRLAFQPPIPLWISGYFPRSIALAARYGDGLCGAVGLQPEHVSATWEMLEAGAAAAGREIDPSNFTTASTTTIAVLEPGESVDSARVREETGPLAISALHYEYEQWRQLGREPGPHVADMWDEYVALLDEVPEDRRHLRVHEGHACWVVPEEERFLTADLIQATCMVGTAEELAERLRGMEAAGLSQVVIVPPPSVKERVLRDVAEKVMPLVNGGENGPAALASPSASRQ